MTQQDPTTAKGADNNEDRGANLAELEAEIDQTRNAISGDLRTLGERLDPAHLKEEAKEVIVEAKNVAAETLNTAKNVATDTFREVKEDAINTVNEKVGALRDNVRAAEHEAIGFLRENAVPLALIGLGVGWFMTNRKRREREWSGDYRERDDWYRSESSGRHRLDEARERTSRLAGGARDAATHARERAERWVDDAGQRARGVADQVGGAARQAEQRVSETAHRARDYASRELDHARDYTRQATEAHPLALGAAAMAAGVGIGLLLPTTRPEQKLLGEQKERLFDDAKGAARDLAQTAQRAAREVKETLTGSSPS
jgi:vacuolar-type H+-ATPase subunit H